MSLSELQHADINLIVAREAYEHASKRLADTLDTKKAFEQKAYTLLGGFLTVSLGMFAAGGAVYQSRELQSLVLPFWLTGLVLVAGTLCFLAALHDKEYGAMASHPEMWLNAGTIDGPDSVLPTMLAYITHHHGKRIDTSEQSNIRKALWIRCGIYCGIAAPMILVVLLYL